MGKRKSGMLYIRCIMHYQIGTPNERSKSGVSAGRSRNVSCHPLPSPSPFSCSPLLYCTYGSRLRPDAFVPGTDDATTTAPSSPSADLPRPQKRNYSPISQRIIFFLHCFAYIGIRAAEYNLGKQIKNSHSDLNISR